ncbi:TPA: hypothetical protein HA273_00710 [Candidatus Bathyarchaeota archaeon]|nr:hypothetical protein [Candidatus Bathyarchaeota archaeon]HIJ08892.1 hypothetical protein [Candidatus Bathyarchaeota archaeon]
MKRKFLLMVLALAVAMLATPLVSAVPLGEGKNDKFQAWHDVGTYSRAGGNMPVVTFVPSPDKINKMVIDLDETMLTYEITVGSNTYYMGTDFAYEGHVKYKIFEPVWTGPTTLPSESRATIIQVTYMFDFSAYPGGIEGVLNMRAVFTEGSDRIRSLSGTGDLRNVEVQLLNIPTVPTPPIITVEHGGMVSGWPNIPPLP